MHGGSVTAHSEGPGRGTEFTIRLPLVATQFAMSVNEGAEAQQVPTVEPKRMLVADDNDDAAESLSLQLQLGGHDVRTAYNGADALAIAESFKPHAVLLDLGMPKMDGYETARKLRRFPWGKRALIIALTGWGQQQDRERTAAAGFDAHLVKPVAEHDLFAALASAGRTTSEADAGHAG